MVRFITVQLLKKGKINFLGFLCIFQPKSLDLLVCTKGICRRVSIYTYGLETLD